MYRSATEFRPDVEGLRGLAVLLVVVFHAGLGLPGGFVGVDVFFVISGYLISGLLLRELDATGTIDFARFYARRVRRLLPAAAVVLIATVAASWWLIEPLDRADVNLDAAAAAASPDGDVCGGAGSGPEPGSGQIPLTSRNHAKRDTANQSGWRCPMALWRTEFPVTRVPTVSYQRFAVD
jgi:hypothetical protein